MNHLELNERLTQNRQKILCELETALRDMNQQHQTALREMNQTHKDELANTQRVMTAAREELESLSRDLKNLSVLDEVRSVSAYIESMEKQIKTIKKSLESARFSASCLDETLEEMDENNNNERRKLRLTVIVITVISHLIIFAGAMIYIKLFGSN